MRFVSGLADEESLGTLDQSIEVAFLLVEPLHFECRIHLGFLTSLITALFRSVAWGCDNHIPAIKDNLQLLEEKNDPVDDHFAAPLTSSLFIVLKNDSKTALQYGFPFRDIEWVKPFSLRAFWNALEVY